MRNPQLKFPRLDFLLTPEPAMKRLPLLALLLAPLYVHAQDDSQPIRVKVTQREDGTHVSSTLDPSAHTCVEDTLSNKEKLLQRVVYQLDDQNQPQSGVVYNPGGDVIYKLTLVHDGMGHVTEESDYAKSGEMIRHLVFHYSSSGMLIGTDAYDGQGNLIKPASAAVRDKKK